MRSRDGQAHDPDPIALFGEVCNTELNGSVYDHGRPRVRGPRRPDPARRARTARRRERDDQRARRALRHVADRMKKHIRLLEEANLVATEKVGRARRCALVPYAFEGITTWLQRLDRFAQVVQRTKGATMSTTVTTPNELEIRVERIFDAPRTHVYSVWTDPS